MRTNAVVAAVLALVIVTGAGDAHAKGMSKGTIDGEGLDVPIAIFGSGSPGADDLPDDTGIYESIWTGSPRHTLDAAPTGDLGPRLTIRWTLMGPNGDDEILQDLYPYADGGPLTYTAPGQPFFETERTVGGWFRAPTRLLTALQALGVPDADALAPPGGGSGGRWVPIGASLAAMILLGFGLARFSRRREEVAPAAS